MNITLVTIAVGLENNKLFQHIRKFFFQIQLARSSGFNSNSTKILAVANIIYRFFYITICLSFTQRV